MVEKKEQKPKDMEREPSDLRYRRQFFPDAERLVFNTERRGFVPFPIILRKLMRHLTPPELRVFIYLQLRASRYFICYPTLEEISYELGVNRKNLTPHLKSLEEKRLISTHTAAGKKYFLIHDPRIAIEHLAAQGKLKDEEIFEINDLYQDLHQSPVVVAKKGGRSSD